MKTEPLSILFALALATATSACVARAELTSSTSDESKQTSARKEDPPAAPVPDAGSHPPSGAHADGDESESPIGLTRAQVRAGRGQPTEIRGNDWIYTPDQPGCRDVIVSEVLTFKRGVVTKVHLQRKQTGKVCRRQWQ